MFGGKRPRLFDRARWTHTHEELESATRTKRYK
jgi:hypothetical protein